MGIVASLVGEVNHLHWSIVGLLAQHASATAATTGDPTPRTTELAILVAAIIVILGAIRSMTHGHGHGVGDALRAIMVGAFAMVLVLVLLIGAAFVIVR